MSTEYRSRRVSQVQLGVVSGSLNDLLRVHAGLVSFQCAGDLPFSPRISRQCLRVVGNLGYRCASRDDRASLLQIRLREISPHLLQVVQSPAQGFLRDLQPEVIKRLQKDALRHHESLSHRAVSGLAEVSALRVFEVGSSRQERYLHIRDLRPGQYASMPFLFQMRHDQALPVHCQHIRPASVLKHQAAPGNAGLQKQMHLRVVPKRLEMPHSFHCSGDRLLVNDRRVSEIHAQPQPLPDHALQDLFLHLSHDLGRDLFFLLIIHEVQGRILLFQNREIPIGFEQVFTGRQDHFAAQNGLQKFFFRAGLCSDPLTDPCPGEAGHGAHFARHCLLSGLKFATRIKADLLHLLRHALIVGAVLKRSLDGEFSACQFHPCESCSAISGDLEDLGAKLLPVSRRLDQHIKAFKELTHALLPQRCAKEHRKQLSSRCQSANIIDRYFLTLQIAVHELIVADRDLLLHLVHVKALYKAAGRDRSCTHGFRTGHDVYTSRTQFLLYSLHQSLSVGAVLVHLVDKNKYGDVIVRQKPPQYADLSVHAVRRADDQYRTVQNSQNALHLCGKVDVPRSVLQSIGPCDLSARRSESGLFGKNSDPSLFFHLICIQERVAVVHAPGVPDRSRDVEERL